MRWRAHEVDGRLSASNATKIRAALRQSANWQRIYAAYQRTQPAVSNNPTQDRARARAWAMLNINFNNEPLMAALRRTLAEGFALGIVSANDAFRQAMELQKAEDPGYIDWKNWKPGNSAAALLIKPTRAFQNLLNGAGVTIRGINSAGYDRIGTALSDAISLGLSAPRAAKLIQDSVSNPARALSIAITEGNRAISRATIESYQGFGVEQVEWTVFDPCPECAVNNGAVVELGRAFPSGNSQPPVHPNCRCALLPVIPGFDERVGPAGVRDIVPPVPETNYNFVPMSNDKDALFIEGYQQRANPNFLAGMSEGQGVLSFEMENALRDYKGSGYVKINQALRDPVFAAESLSQIQADTLAGKIKAIDAAMDLAPKVETPFVTLRGVAGDVATRLSSLPTGAVFSDDAFVSTTFKYRVAENFIDREGDIDKLIIEIVNTPSAKGIMMDRLDIIISAGEMEWLLARGTKFEVVHVYQGKTRMRVKVVP